MSRTPQERTTSRTGQVHLCAVCVADAGGYGSVGLMKQLTWMLEIPPESDTSARLGGRARTWFCRTCIESIFKIDTIFAERNGHLELLDPQWWNDPATDAQIAYLSGLLDQRGYPRISPGRSTPPSSARPKARSPAGCRSWTSLRGSRATATKSCSSDHGKSCIDGESAPVPAPPHARQGRDPGSDAPGARVHERAALVRHVAARHARVLPSNLLVRERHPSTLSPGGRLRKTRRSLRRRRRTLRPRSCGLWPKSSFVASLLALASEPADLDSSGSSRATNLSASSRSPR